jgi:CP family cyanate transporter-like MFS transporter
VGAGTALFLAALALRPQVVAIGPLAGDIARDLSVSHAFVGVLTTVPILCMGIFAPLGPEIARRFGARRALAAALIGLAGAAIARSFLPSAEGIVLATLGIGIATGAAGALPQVIAKLHAPSRPAGVSGGASAGIVAGAVLSAAAAVPLADLLGGWRGALVALAFITLGTTAIGMSVLRPDPDAPKAGASRQPRRSLAAWLLAAVFGLQAILYWGAGAWLPGTFLERGWTPSSAAGLVAIVNASALAASLIVALVSDRLGRRIVQIRASVLGACGATIGLTLLPDGAVLWTLALGLSLGAVFPLLLIHTVDVALDPADAGSVSAFMLLVGYVIAGLGPVGLGLVRDVTGGFNGGLAVLAAVSALLVAVSFARSLGPFRAA